jgi:hypothetical protein
VLSVSRRRGSAELVLKGHFSRRLLTEIGHVLM